MPQPILFPVVPNHAEPKGFETLEVQNTLASVVCALKHLPGWVGALATNEFDQRLVFRREPPFSNGGLTGSPVRDQDFDRMRLWFEEARGVVLSKAIVTDAARLVANESAFHPVQEYLNRLSWDGVPRVDTWLEDFCAVRPRSAEQQGLIRAVGRKWLVSCVARAMSPGCKVDTILILEGRQGIGKSTALRALAGAGFYCDSLIDFGTKEACQTIQGVWIYELAELDALLRRETSVIKAFLTRAVDRFRVPYGRVPESVPRSVVFAGTVNHGGYLRDRTGNRRFWVVRCEDSLDPEGLQAARNQLWAEARHLYDQGEAWHLSKEDDALMRVEHGARLEVDAWEETILRWVSSRAAETFTMNELLEGALGLKAQSKNPQVTRRVSLILEELGFERRKRSSLPRTYFYGRAEGEGAAGEGVSPSHRPTRSE